MDDADRAGIEIERQEARALKKIQLKQQFTVEDSADDCEQCGNQIPSARQIASPGCTMCVECASRAEQEKGQFRTY